MTQPTLPPELRSMTVRNYPEDWTEADTRAVDTARVLAADAVEHCGSGHPGTAMSLAPLAYTLYQRVMNVDPNDKDWVGRDRFVLSNGHSSLTQYIQLYLGGFGLELKDLMALRTWASKTPGHPEYNHTDHIEITTGPLGQGLASAVGMAMAARRERGLFDPEAAPGESPFDHFVYVIAGDGCLQEGVTSEASSLAGTQQLGNLIAFWDDNRISIEDDTRIAFTEDVLARYEAYGWQTLTVESGEDVVAIEEAVRQAQAETGKPSLIRVKTVIGYPAPTMMNTGAVHGAALGADEVAGVKMALGFDPAVEFPEDAEIIAHTRALAERAATKRSDWDSRFAAWVEANPERKQLFDRLAARELPQGWNEGELAFPTWEPDAKGLATRKASEAAIQVAAKALPELWGGSADLAGSNNTLIKGESSFGPETISTNKFTTEPYGRNLHFGIREHAMGAIMNGIALHGPTRVYGGTFLIFSEYLYPAIRVAALSGIDGYYVFTHDSIGLGEDGPTHQPVETLTALRAIPDLAVVRPADANETSAAWKAALEAKEQPKALALSRQNLPVLEGTREKAFEGVARGGYVLVEESGERADLIIIATGSEVQYAVEAAARLESEGTTTRVVSMPCMEWFMAQDEAYIDSVLPRDVRARVSVEAGVSMPWFRFLGEHGRAVSLEHFGASAPGAELFERFGFTTENVVDAAHESLASASQQQPENVSEKVGETESAPTRGDGK